MDTNVAVSKLAESLLSQLDECKTNEDRLLFLDDLLENEPPADLLAMVCLLTGLEPEFIVNETRALARARRAKLVSQITGAE